MKLSEMQKQLKQCVNCNNNVLNISVVTNVILDPYFSLYINKVFSEIDTAVEQLLISYDEYLTEENLHKLIKADYIVICLDFNCLYPNIMNDRLLNKLNAKIILQDTISKLNYLYSYIKKQTKSPVLWLGFEDYAYPHKYIIGNIPINDNLIDCINNELYSLLKNNDIYVDFKKMIANIGINNAFNPKGKYRWNMPYSQLLIAEICNEIYKQHLIHNGISKKCIVLDCDNVLWGGVLSEDGIERVSLGASGLGSPFQDFQCFLLTLYYHGVILTICSKNDRLDVLSMFKEHSEMILKEEHIACFQVNWDNKLDNIKKIAEKLNISLNSMVFIDDSDFEIQSVKSMLPEVTAIKYDRDNIYEQLSVFNLRDDVDMEKTKKRNDTYKTDEQRTLLKAVCQSFEEYITSLEMKIDIHQTLPIELSRVAELTQRTNKCTNGQKYTVDQLREMISKQQYMLYSVFVMDKFSDMGLVGVFGIDCTSLDLFSLYCRALGRNIEHKMIEEILKYPVTDFVFSRTSNNGILYDMLKDKIMDKRQCVVRQEE